MEDKIFDKLFPTLILSLLVVSIIIMAVAGLLSIVKHDTIRLQTDTITPIETVERSSILPTQERVENNAVDGVYVLDKYFHIFGGYLFP